MIGPTDATHKWIRTCQECGHKQETTNPGNHPPKNYTEQKCRKCKSISLDWGKWKER